MDELDRILDRHDVPRIGLVDLVDDRCKRGRLAGTGRPRDENQPLLEVRQVADGLGQVQVLERDDLFGNDSKNTGGPGLLHEVVGSKSRDAIETERKVEIAGRIVFIPGPGRCDLLHHAAERILRQRRLTFDHLHGALRAKTRRLPGDQVEVGTIIFLDMYQQIKLEESSLFDKLEINISLDDSAIDELIRQAIETGEEAGPLTFQLAKKLEYGLKLVKDRSGTQNFVINGEAVTDMEKFINGLVTKFYREDYEQFKIEGHEKDS